MRLSGFLDVSENRDIALTPRKIEYWPSVVFVHNDLLRLNLHLALEGRVDDRRVAFLATAKIPMESVHQPSEKLDWISLLGRLEFTITAFCDLGVKLVRRDLCFEQARIP